MAISMPRRGRWIAAPAAALAALLALSGCGSPTETAAPATSALPAAEGTTQYPLTLTTWAGESVLEKRPERIAVIGFSPNLDALEALDVIPVYSQKEDAVYPWRDQAWFSKIETRDTVTRRDPINFEGIAATNPDLILATNFVQDDVVFQKLAAIAPVLENPTKVAGDKIQWQETQRLVGRTLDLAAASDRAVADAEKVIADTAKANPQFAGRTITVATEYTKTGIDYYTVAGGTAESLFLQLGFAPNPLAKEFSSAARVAEEQLGKLDADLLLMLFLDAAARDKRQATPLFAALPPVTQGRYLSIVGTEPGSEVTWVLRRGASATSYPWAVKVITDRINQAGLS